MNTAASMKNIWLEEMPDGAHSGQRILDVFYQDPGYLYWYATQGHSPEVAQQIYQLFGPQKNIPLDLIDVDSVLKQAKLNVDFQHNMHVVTGQTYPVRHLLKMLGGSYSPTMSGFVFMDPPALDIALSLVDPNAPDTVLPGRLNPEGEKQRQHALRTRHHFDSLPDARQSDAQYREAISSSTQALLQRGMTFDIPESVVEEQIIDAGKIKEAFLRQERLFLLASEAGSGKTFVLGAAIREIHAAAPELTTLYVTLRDGLIKQIQRDLADYGLENVEFTTYAKLAKGVPDRDWTNTLLVLDEAHSVKNPESKSGACAGLMLQHARMAIYASATPWESPADMGYLEPSGIFEPQGFKAFAIGHGAYEVIRVTPNGYGGTRTQSLLQFKNDAPSLEGAKASREFFIKKGIYTQRQKRLPKHLVTSNFHTIEADPFWLEVFHHVSEAYDLASSNAKESGQDAIILAHKINLQKRLLEAAKAPAAMALAEQAQRAGQQVVLFVETKAPRVIGNVTPFKELLDTYNAWAAMPPRFRSYPAPVTKTQLYLAEAFDQMGVNYPLPSIVDTLVSHFGIENTAVYVGAAAFESLNVTDASAEKSLKAWKAGELPYLVATMAKGGTGLSLHPQKKGMPRTQIGFNLPWKASGVDQVTGRVARYGMKSQVNVDWLFCPDIPVEKELAQKVCQRMKFMGASVNGLQSSLTDQLEEWNLENSDI